MLICQTRNLYRKMREYNHDSEEKNQNALNNEQDFYKKFDWKLYKELY